MLLKSIWDGGIKTPQSRISKEVIRLLELVLPLNTVCYSTGTGVTRSCMIPEEIELSPDLPLGDVLAEELSSDIPIGALIVIIKDQTRTGDFSQSDASLQLGLLIGDALLNIVGEGLFPLEQEADALLLMAKSYCQFIDNSDFRQQKICSQSFHQGLMQSLSEYSNGKTQSRANTYKPTQYHNSYMASFNSDLKTPGACNWMRGSKQKYIDLSQLYKKPCDHNNWKKGIVRAVLNELRTDATRVYNH